MPSTSAKQHRFMEAIAHSPSFAKKAGVSQAVGKDFAAADKGKTFNKGGDMKKPNSLFKGKETYGEELKEAKAVKSGKISPKQYASGEESEKPKKFAKGKETYGEELKEANAIKSGKISPEQYAMGEESEKPKKFARGGSTGRPDPRMLAAMMARRAAGSQPMRRPQPDGMAPQATPSMAPPMAPQAAPSMAPPMAPQAGMKKGGSVNFAKGGGIESKGKTKGTIIRMASGGSVSSASRRADGIAQRGKTRC